MNEQEFRGAEAIQGDRLTLNDVASDLERWLGAVRNLIAAAERGEALAAEVAALEARKRELSQEIAEADRDLAALQRGQAQAHADHCEAMQRMSTAREAIESEMTAARERSEAIVAGLSEREARARTAAEDAERNLRAVQQALARA